MTNSQEKKKNIEKKIQAIEKRFDQKLQATKETIEIGKSPQKLVSKRPFSSLFIFFSLGLLAGKMVRNGSSNSNITSNTQDYCQQNGHEHSDSLEERKSLVSSSIKQRLKRRISQKLIDSLLNYGEELLNDYMRKVNLRK
ncbi:MAG: hypothetical protein ISR37_04145 [Balneolaceae bacterium]|jgi:hypothetical protein|nr:hypothetical protein [Balneolaceae bacterium]|tara:strand:- start:4083 stop:4502 length:420 start_codon:yes stop_codon:yes gene_type:complete